MNPLVPQSLRGSARIIPSGGWPWSPCERTLRPCHDAPATSEEGCSMPDAPADVFVVFGITGDLAKVMTFRSLYRLERRGLLQCPIVGVAVNDWTLEHLKAHARECIEGTGEPVDDAVFKQFAERLSYVQGDFGAPETYE